MKLEVGSILNGKVTGITKFGAFVDLGDRTTGLVHISEVASAYVKEVSDYLKIGQEVKVKVLQIGEDGKINLSIRQAEAPSKTKPASRPRPSGGYAPRKSQNNGEPMSFEDMMSRFKQSSDEKMSDLKRSLDGKRGSYSRRAAKQPK